MLQEIDMATHRPQMKKVLCIGGYGSGKTHFIGTAPKPALVVSFDKGYDTIAMTPGIKVVSVLEETRQRPKAWEEFRLRWARILNGEEYTWPDGRKERYKTFALDGMTFMSDIAMNYYQYMGQNVDKKATYTQYQQILENVMDIINDAKRCMEYVICTALIKIEKDELSGEVLSLPAMTGSIRDNIGAQFDAVFYFYTDKTPQGKEVFRMKTVGGYREKAKLRLPADIRQVIAPTIEDPDFGKLLKMVDECITNVYGDRPQPPPSGTIVQATSTGTVAPAPQPESPQPKPASAVSSRPVAGSVGKPGVIQSRVR